MKITLNLKGDRTSTIKELLKTNMNLASAALSRMLNDPSFLEGVAPSPLFKYINEVKFCTSTKTATVDLKNRTITINPEFFIKNIEDVRDLLFLIMHEREHVINHIKYDRAEIAFRSRRHYQLLKKIGLDERFLEDVYINFSLARLFKKVKTIGGKRYVPLSAKFYSNKRKLRDALLSGVLTPSVKRRVRETFGVRALMVLEDLSRMHIPLYFQFIHAFVPVEGEGKGDSQNNQSNNYSNQRADRKEAYEGPEEGEEEYENEEHEHKEGAEKSRENYSDYEDLTSGSESYIFTNDNSYSHDGNCGCLVRVSPYAGGDLSKLATVFDGLLGHGPDLLRPSPEDHLPNVKGDEAYYIFNHLVKELRFTGKSVCPPERLSRKDAFLLSSNFVPMLWDVDYSPEGIKFAVYYDVSYSMYNRYGLVYSLKKVLAPYIDKAYQFSGFIVNDDEVPEGYFRTDTTTRIRNVLKKIIEERQKNVILVSDFCAAFEEKDRRLVDEIKSFIENFVMIEITSYENRVIKGLRALDPIEIKVE